MTNFALDAWGRSTCVSLNTASAREFIGCRKLDTRNIIGSKENHSYGLSPQSARVGSGRVILSEPMERSRESHRNLHWTRIDSGSLESRKYLLVCSSVPDHTYHVSSIQNSLPDTLPGSLTMVKRLMSGSVDIRVAS